jgi:hypothetical protein
MIRKFFIAGLILVLGTVISVNAQFQYPNFKWENTEHDFGEIQHLDPVVYEFEFTNKGQAPLVISEVEGSCGCTVAEYTKDPVMPGKKGKVKATFDAAAMGKFRKSIKVVANVEGGPEYLYIKGTVIEQPQAESQGN